MSILERREIILHGQLFCVNLSRSQNLNKVTVLLNGVNVTMEIDMGASTTVVDEKTFNSRVEEQGWRSGDCTRLPPTWPGFGP